MSRWVAAFLKAAHSDDRVRIELPKAAMTETGAAHFRGWYSVVPKSTASQLRQLIVVLNNSNPRLSRQSGATETLPFAPYPPAIKFGCFNNFALAFNRCEDLMLVEVTLACGIEAPGT
jgi:hypothetical protein